MSQYAAEDRRNSKRVQAVNTMLKEMVQAKTGHITSEQWHKALEVAKAGKLNINT